MTTRGALSPVLTRQALNRALLERQSLLRRDAGSVEDMLERLVGMQAQLPNPPYFGLWSRLRGFAPDRLSGLLSSRAAVRITLMRGTIHLVTARDCLALRPVLQPALERAALRNTTYGGDHLAGVDLGAVLRTAEQILAATPLEPAGLRAALAERWPQHDPAILGFAARSLLPLVHVPPRGLWGHSGQPVSTPVRAWLGRDLDPPRPAAVIERFLAAFGPATVADVQRWSGLTGLRAVTDEMDLRTFRTEDGARLLDLPDAPLPDPTRTAPVRFLPPWDNAILAYADRSRIVDDTHRRRWLATANGVPPGTVLIDGMARAGWRLETDRAGATVQIQPFEPIPRSRLSTVESEGARLLRFAAPEDRAHEVRITDPS